MSSCLLLVNRSVGFIRSLIYMLKSIVDGSARPAATTHVCVWIKSSCTPRNCRGLIMHIAAIKTQVLACYISRADGDW